MISDNLGFGLGFGFFLRLSLLMKISKSVFRLYSKQSPSVHVLRFETEADDDGAFLWMPLLPKNQLLIFFGFQNYVN